MSKLSCLYQRLWVGGLSMQFLRLILSLSIMCRKFTNLICYKKKYFRCNVIKIFQMQLPIPTSRTQKIRTKLRHFTVQDYDGDNEEGGDGINRITLGTPVTRRWTTSTPCPRRRGWWRSDRTYGAPSSKFMASILVFLLSQDR